MSLARTAAVVLLVGTPLLGLSAAAHADAPTDTGWWNFATRDGLPKPPPPSDMNDGDLLVQAGDPSGASVGSPDGNARPSAVAALRFTIPAGSSVGALSFEVANGATAMDVRAYQTSSSWKPVQNGPLTDAPIANRSRYSLGVINGSTLVFADISRLVPETGALSVVILPGAADRVVLRKPGPNTLKITSGQTTTTTSDGSVPPQGGSSSSGAGGGTFPAAGGAGTAQAPPLTSGGPLQAPTGADPGAGPPVAVAPPVTAPEGGSTQPVAARAPMAPVDDARTRYYAAAEIALVLITFGLFGWGPFARLAPLVGGGQQTPAGNDPPVRGVGRFSGPREGTFVRL